VSRIGRSQSDVLTIRTFFFSLFACFLSAAAATAQQPEEKQKPLWEVGVVGAMAYVPDYPAASQNHAHFLPLPFAIYRGDILRVGDESIIRGRFFESDRYEFDVSMNGSFPVDSDSNNARDGMDDLDYLFEVGPRLQIALAKAPKWAKIDLELAVRAVFSTDLSGIEYQGAVFHPKLAYERKNLLGAGSRLKVGIGPIIANSGLHEYFYEVDPKFARAGRPAYEADAGYLGTELQVSLFTPITDQFRIVGAVRGGYYKGSANEDSPLYREDWTLGGGIAVIWSFLQSDAHARD